MVSDTIHGSCSASSTGLKVAKSSADTFNVSMLYNCQLKVKEDKIVDFTVGLQLIVEGNPAKNYMRFKLRGHSFSSAFFPCAEFPMQNQDKAVNMVRSALLIL